MSLTETSPWQGTEFRHIAERRESTSSTPDPSSIRPAITARESICHRYEDARDDGVIISGSIDHRPGERDSDADINPGSIESENNRQISRQLSFTE